jgi:small subunit ribosomal protein S18
MVPAARKRRPQLAPEEIDWKNFPSLRRFLSERGKIRSRRITGLSRRQQSQLAKAVKRARTMGLFPYPDQERQHRERSATGGAPPRAERPPRDDERAPREDEAVRDDVVAREDD